MSLRVWLPLTKDLRQQGLSNVTVTNSGATYESSGKLGGCYNLTNGPINITNLPNPTSISVAFWFKRTANTNTRQFMFTAWSGVTCELTTDGKPTFAVYRDNYPTITGPTAITTSTGWIHYCGTFSPTEGMKMYLNGELVVSNTNTTAISWSTTTGQIGKYGSYASMSAQMDDFRIYDHCLSPMEVKELSKGLVLHYPLNRQGWGQENLLKVNCCSGGNRATFLENGRRVKINWTSNAGDTYWYLGLASGVTLTEGKTYTLSFQCSGLGSNTVSFRWCNLANYDVFLKNGFNAYTFSMPSTSITNPFFDDGNRDTSLSDLELWNFKLEEGSIATPWCPNSSDALATTMDLNSTTEYDCSGFCNNGTRTGTFTWTSNTPKYAVSTNFAAIGTIINNTSPIHLSNEFTIAWWGKINSWKKNWEGMFLLQNNATLNAGTNTYDIMSALHASTANSMSLTICQNGSSYAFDRYKWTYTIGVWAHYTCTYKAGVVTMYQNGTSIYTETITDNSSNDYYYRLGHRANFCDCQISDFRIYATALSASDVKSLYQNSAYIDSSGNVYGAVHSEV